MILDTIATSTKARVARLKAAASLAAVRRAAENMPPARDFRAALAREGFNIIAELKKASPSKGLIAANFADIYLEKARSYEEGGAAAISCLTEPEFFGGSDVFLQQSRAAVSLPVLRKDFTVDEFHINEARAIGADAILLICTILSPSQLQEYLQLAAELGMAALTEIYRERELEMALDAGAEIIGVNNRNLQDFSVNTGNSLNLKQAVPQDKIFVAESGITSAEDTAQLRRAGVQAALIGEALMRAADARQMLRDLRGEER